MAKATLLAIALAAWPGAAASAADPRIVFLPQDVSDGYDHAGTTPDLLGGLERFVASHAPRSYVKMEVGRVLRAGVEPYYIYRARYCAPIGRVLGANVFVMAHLTVVEKAPRVADQTWDVEAKAYSSETGREIELFRAKRVRGQVVPGLTRGREEELLRKILSVAAPRP